MKIKAIYENGVLKPLKKLDLKEKEEVEIEINNYMVDKTYSISKLSSEKIDEIIESTEKGE
ncbi:MAG: antitoxin AF2212-like protein [Methanosarcinales archaeon]